MCVRQAPGLPRDGEPMVKELLHKKVSLYSQPSALVGLHPRGGVQSNHRDSEDSEDREQISGNIRRSVCWVALEVQIFGTVGPRGDVECQSQQHKHT